MLVMDVEEGERVAAADVVGVVVWAAGGNVIVGPETGSCDGMAEGDGGWGLGAALGPKAWLRLEDGETG